MDESNDNASPNNESALPIESAQEGESDASPLPETRTSISVWGFVKLLLSIWGVALVVALSLGGVAYLRVGEFNPVAGLPIPFLMFMSVILWVVTLYLCARMGCIRYGIGIAEGFSIRRVDAKVIFLSIKWGIGLALFAIVLSYIGTIGQDAPIYELFNEDANTQTSGIPWSVMAFAILAAPLEELYYRGFIYRVIQGFIGTWMSAILIVVWFGMMHAFQVGGDVLAIGVIMSVGGVDTYLRIRYNSVIPSMVCHICYNGFLMGLTLVGYLMESGTVATTS